MVNYDSCSVRRQERLLDQEAALELLRQGEYGVLSMIECRGGQKAAYGIPINYVWDGDASIYVHCAPAGHKLACLETNALVSFAVVGATRVIAHQFTTAYQSIVVRGSLERGLSESERMAALVLLLDKYSPNDKEVGLQYAQKSFARTEVLRLKIDSISGKTKRIAP